MWNPYEYPFLGAVIAVAVMIILWLFGIFWPEKRRRWHPVIPLVILAAALALTFFAQTTKEKITAAIKQGAKSFETQNIELFAQIVADDYGDTSNKSKENLLKYCQSVFPRAQVEKITFYGKEFDITGDRATFTVKALIKFGANSPVAQMGKEYLLLKGKFYFRRTSDKRWLIYNSEVLEIDKKAFNWQRLKSL
ncbi:MAG: hypothetical protein JW806_04620 [Sedimentisphaerales bacterium]|nr:hypothetical protein [Sedimentisphaerales bacterium]